MSAIAVDTPDYQRGVVSAQVLLAHVAANVGSESIGIPPNAETICVVLSGAPPIGTVVTLATSGGIIPQLGVSLPAPNSRQPVTWFFDASSVLTATTIVRITPTPTSEWFVYADSGVHLVADGANLRNGIGEQYVVPTVPGTTTGDHPPNELAHISGDVPAPGIILPAPGAGTRCRIFSAACLASVAGDVALLFDVPGQAFCIGTATDPGPMTFYPSGLPLAVNTAVTGSTLAGGGNVVATLTYTTEIV